ncbi:MAG: tetratricopeptide repeat protein [Cyanophyceae cyanobacterium]
MDTADELHLQSIAQAQQGQLAAAINLWQQALQRDPKHLLSWQNLAIAQHKAYDFARAAESNQRALQLTTDAETQANLHLNLGAALAKLKEFEGAIASYQAALKFKPNWYSAQRNLGNVLALNGNLLQAETLLREVLAREPNDGENHHGLGNALREQGRYEDAIVCFHRAIALKPDFAEAHCNLALIKSLLGNWIDGAAEYEWRLRCPDMLRLLPTTVPFPLWQGESLRGKTLMVYGDMGLGDCLNFMRYVVPLEHQGAKVIMVLPKSLVAIAQTLPGAPQILSQSDPIRWDAPEHSAIDYWCPLFSMIHRFRTTPATIPASIPYLQASGDCPPLPKPIKPNALQKLGIVWQSGKLSDTQRQRSTQLHQWQPIAALPHTQLYSLQKERTPQEQTQLHAWKSIDLADQLTDFSATAHHINQLDAVLTVDTAVAHLAGALGKPVYVLLPHVPDWRWGLTDHTTPWYPTMRLIRQPALDHWEPAIANLARLFINA